MIKKFIVLTLVTLFAINPVAYGYYTPQGADVQKDKIILEGDTDDAYELTIDSTDPTGDRTITLPDASGTMSLLGSAESFSGVKTFTADPLITGTTPTLTIGDAGEEDAQINFDGNVVDFSIGLDDSADALSISLSTVLGTTEVLKADGTTVTVTDALAVDGAFTTTAASTLGNAVTDGVTITGAVQGTSAIYFDGSTDDTVETILSITDPTSSDKTVTIPNQTGTVLLAGAATALTPGAAVSLTVAPGFRIYTDTITTDNEDQTITFSGAGSAGDIVVIKFTTDAAGSGDEVITFHSTLVNSTGTLTLANAAADVYVVTFISDGTKWNELCRTAIQATP